MTYEGGPPRHLGRTRRQSIVTTRCAFVCGDAGRGAVVALAGTAIWSLPPEPDEAYGSVPPDPSAEFRLQYLAVERGMSAGSVDPMAIEEWLLGDRDRQPNGPLKACFQVIETGGNPALAQHLGTAFDLGVREGLVRQVFLRLTNSQTDPDAYMHGSDPRASHLVGIGGLPGEYDRIVSRAAPAQLQSRHGMPYDPTSTIGGRSVVTFAGFAHEPAPGMRLSDVHSAMASATQLRARAAPAGADDYAVELELPEHLVAACVMLGVLGLRLAPPSPSAPPYRPFGWASPYGDDSIDRRWDRPIREPQPGAWSDNNRPRMR